MKRKISNFKLKLLWSLPCYLDFRFHLNSYNSLSQVNVFIKVNVVLYVFAIYCNVFNICLLHVSYINCIREGVCVHVCVCLCVYVSVKCSIWFPPKYLILDSHPKYVNVWNNSLHFNISISWGINFWDK